MRLYKTLTGKVVKVNERDHAHRWHNRPVRHSYGAANLGRSCGGGD